jgi:hypothetical protein
VAEIVAVERTHTLMIRQDDGYGAQYGTFGIDHASDEGVDGPRVKIAGKVVDVDHDVNRSGAFGGHGGIREAVGQERRSVSAAHDTASRRMNRTSPSVVGNASLS